MTMKAVDLLDNPNGFFLMVEGGKIDHACHANDGATAFRDLIALDDAIRAVLQDPRLKDNTLIIITGDHETGGLFKPENPWNPKLLAK